LCDQFGHQFYKIVFNEILLVNGVKIVNDTITT